jgi:hypothetical protein
MRQRANSNFRTSWSPSLFNDTGWRKTGIESGQEGIAVKAKLIAFGEIEIEGVNYDHDVVIEAGKVRRRAKKVSKVFRDQYGHTPLSFDEAIPWGGRQLIVGTGMHGSLPIMPEVHKEAKRRGIKIVAQPTQDACKVLGNLRKEEVYAILHITC